jgi:sigma-B regulation protein RsbU (phosphoserine phosphatase)
LVKHLQDQLSQIETELQSAQRMQIDMLPSDKVLEETYNKYHINIHHYFEPSSVLGGDFWQIFPLSKTRLGFYICDFSGHGVASALNTFRLHALVSQNNLHLKTPALFLKHLNKQMHLLLPRGQFATMFLGILDIRNKTLTYSGAGAPNPIFIRGKRGRLLSSEGLPLGILPNPEYKNFCIQLQKGDSLLLYSDALIEAPNKKGERLGTKIFKDKAIKLIANQPPEEGLNDLLKAFFEFAPPPPPDDVTAVLLRWEQK